MANFSREQLKTKFDTTTSGKSLASHVEPLISKMEKMTAADIAKEFDTILHNEDVYVSDKTKNKWKDVIDKNRNNKLGLMKAISNLYLAGAQMAVESESFEPGLKHVQLFEDFKTKKR